ADAQVARRGDADDPLGMRPSRLVGHAVEVGEPAAVRLTGGRDGAGAVAVGAARLGDDDVQVAGLAHRQREELLIAADARAGGAGALAGGEVAMAEAGRGPG